MIEVKTLQLQSRRFCTIWKLLEYASRYIKIFSWNSSKSQHYTASVLPIISCDAKIITLHFTLKAVRTWKTLQQEPNRLITTRNVLLLCTTNVSPMLPFKGQLQTPGVMPSVSCDAKITTLPFTHKTVTTRTHCSCSPTAFLQLENYKNMRFSTTKWTRNHRVSLRPEIFGIPFKTYARLTSIMKRPVSYPARRNLALPPWVRYCKRRWLSIWTQLHTELPPLILFLTRFEP